MSHKDTETVKERSSSYRSQKATVASMSIAEKLGMIPVVLSIVGNTVVALITGIFRSKDSHPKGLACHLFLTAIRTLNIKATARQEHFIIPPTDTAYEKACKRRSVVPHSLTLSDGTQAHWIGSPSAQHLLLNFHGGGYVVPASPEMCEFMFQVVDHLNQQSSHADVAVLMLSYDLAPGAVYPRQLQQGALLLNHVLHELHVPPERILLVGDSAGANLAVGLLGHILHPHPSEVCRVPPVELGKGRKLLGAALISPWLSFDFGLPSFRRATGRDCVSVEAGKKWSTAFLACPWPHKGAVDNYNEPTIAPPSWFAPLPTILSHLFIVAGADEGLLDAIQLFDTNLRAAVRDPDTQLDIESLWAAGEYHDQLNVHLPLKPGEEPLSARAVKGWLARVLGG